jgi:hypothetical protein
LADSAAADARSTVFDSPTARRPPDGSWPRRGQAPAAALAIAWLQVGDGRVAMQAVPVDRWVPVPMRPDLGL